MAAVVALATVAGALGGALATAGFAAFVAGRDSDIEQLVLEASMARIDADLVALKASVEHTSKMGMSQFNKTSDRLDKVEKAQAEPAAKLAKLSDAVDKLRAARRGGRRRGAAPRRRRKSPARSHLRRRRRPRHPRPSRQARGRQAADGRRLGAARCRQWRRADRGPPGHL